MEIGVIIANTVVLISLLLTHVFTQVNETKSRYIELSTKQTIHNMHIFRENAEILHRLSSPYVIKCCYEKNMEKLVEDVMTASSKIEYIMKVIYPQELEIINAERQLIQAIITYASCPQKTNLLELEKCSNYFYYMTSIYDYADIQYVELQSSGKRRGFSDFNQIFMELKRDFESSPSPVTRYFDLEDEKDAK